jgi:peptide deformylase
MLKIVTVPSNTLSSPTKPVGKIDDKIKKIVFEMEKILTAQTDPPGVGLAANQVGLDLSIFIIRPSEKSKTKVFINPKILNVGEQFIAPKIKGVINHAPTKKSKSKKKIKLEGCLSIPRIWGPVKRAERVFLKYQDLNGKTHLKWFSGFEAAIIQHEVDHLNGVVFTQRSLEQKGQLYREENEELVKIEY